MQGAEPNYFDKGPNKSKGTAEYITHPIVQNLETKGFKVEREYVTPARFRQMIIKNKPVCTYPLMWSDPKLAFSNKPITIRSLGLELGQDRQTNGT